MSINQHPRKRSFGHSRKKKNTYVLHIGGMIYNPAELLYSPSTPMTVLTKNGATTKEGDITFEYVQHFPNPMTTQMIMAYNNNKPIMGRLASTVVEYLDKETGEPIILLFPHSIHPHLLKNFPSLQVAENRLNHATWRDLTFQIELRRKLLQIVKQSRRTR